MGQGGKGEGGGQPYGMNNWSRGGGIIELIADIIIINNEIIMRMERVVPSKLLAESLSIMERLK